MISTQSKRTSSPLTRLEGAKMNGTSKVASPIKEVREEDNESLAEVTAWQNEMDSLEQTQMKIQSDQTNTMFAQIKIIMRELGDLQKRFSWLATRTDDTDARIDDLAGKMDTAMEEAHAALRLELAEQGNNAQEMKAAMEEAHSALSKEMQMKQAEHAKALSEHAEAHSASMSEMQSALQGDLQKLAEDHANSHAEHHEKHAQNAEALESGLQNVLESTHDKLQAELQALRADGSSGPLKDILTDVTQQVDTITQTLETEHQLRMAVEVKLDQMCDELRSDLEKAFNESHAALKLELAEQGGKAEDIKAAMEEAHAALRGELAVHVQSNEDRHKASEEALSLMNDEHHEKHAANAEKFEAGLNEALGNTHAKLQEELKLLRGGGVGSLADLSKILTDVTQQVDGLDQSLQKEHELRMAVETRMDKMFNDQDRVVCELHRELKTALNEAHAALKLELAEQGKNSDEIKAAMYEAHKALQSEHGRVTGDLADKLDMHGQTHNASLAELENKLRSDLMRNSNEVEARQRDLKAMSAKHEANHSTLDQRIHLLELSCTNKYEDSFKELQSAHGKIQDLQSNMQNHKSRSDMTNASMQERIETLERQLKERTSCHDALHGKFQGEALVREKNMNTVDQRLSKLESYLNETAERQSKDVEGAHNRVREALSKFEQQRTSLENHKAIVDQRLSYLDKAVVEAQDNHSQTFAQAISSMHTDHAKELTYSLQAERAAREAQEKTFLDFIQDAREQKEAFESTMQEQIRLERVAREVQWNQLKDSISIKEKMWHGGNSEYADILLQEHSAREAVERSIEHKVDAVERSLQVERSERSQDMRRLWDALDTHTHDAISPPTKPAEAKPISQRYVSPERHLERHLLMSPRSTIVHPARRMVSPPAQENVHLERHLVMSPIVQPPTIAKTIIVEPPSVSGKTLVTPLSGYQSPVAPLPTGALTGTTISRMASQGTISTSGSISVNAMPASAISVNTLAGMAHSRPQQ